MQKSISSEVLLIPSTREGSPGISDAPSQKSAISLPVGVYGEGRDLRGGQLSVEDDKLVHRPIGRTRGSLNHYRLRPMSM